MEDPETRFIMENWLLGLGIVLVIFGTFTLLFPLFEENNNIISIIVGLFGVGLIISSSLWEQLK